jgi:Domain of unknown function (DUF6458)
MGIGMSIFLIAVGAILRFAVYASVHGIALETVGLILMIVGVLGLLLTLTIWGPWSFAERRGSSSVLRTETISTADPGVPGVAHDVSVEKTHLRTDPKVQTGEAGRPAGVRYPNAALSSRPENS